MPLAADCMRAFPREPRKDNRPTEAQATVGLHDGVWGLVKVLTLTVYVAIRCLSLFLDSEKVNE